MKGLIVPKFETEAEEARLWDDHMDKKRPGLGGTARIHLDL